MKNQRTSQYYIVKASKAGSELLEVVEATNEMEARKQVVVKYMNIALSVKTNLLVVTKSAYEQNYMA